MAENISEMGLLHLVVQVTSLLQLVQGGRWVFLGGFTGLEEGGDRVGEINTDNDVDGGDEDDAGDDFEDGFDNFCSFCCDLIAKGFWSCGVARVVWEQCEPGEKQIWRQVPQQYKF